VSRAEKEEVESGFRFTDRLLDMGSPVKSYRVFLFR
jgi:hypothetical protein